MKLRRLPAENDPVLEAAVRRRLGIAPAPSELAASASQTRSHSTKKRSVFRPLRPALGALGCLLGLSWLITVYEDSNSRAVSPALATGAPERLSENLTTHSSTTSETMDPAAEVAMASSPGPSVKQQLDRNAVGGAPNILLLTADATNEHSAPNTSGQGNGALQIEVFNTSIAEWLNLREEPSIEANILLLLAPGDSITGSLAKEDGLEWVPVRTADGTRGWVVNEGLD